MDDDYVCTLSPESVVKAQKELNEDPKDRLASVKALREWLLQQPHMTAPTGMLVLLEKCVQRKDVDPMLN